MATPHTTVDLEIENVYPDAMSTTHLTNIDVTPPSALTDEALDDWADEELFPLTGTGREGGNPMYQVSINGSSDSRLIGLSFSFG